MTDSPNVDAAEIAHFDRIAQLWWDPHGKMGQLHAINGLRLRFITDRLTGTAPRVVDVGCGGGILAEALAKHGARVTGIDLSTLSLKVARQHAERGALAIDYREIDVETLAREEAGTFDAVTCMEMLEHVPEPARVIAACARLLKPGGVAFFSTINRNFKAFAFAIVAGEYILGLLPRGTHSYRKLIRPTEMRAWASAAGLQFNAVASLMYHPLKRSFRVAPGREDINYMASFTKRG
ncbi:MAG: bifunctional 2-polyprenyl-6-hydroxyphenol methylase/3-demethylubiquinol 3-O-methyltransferase UbiG [Rhodanobacter sp.]|jgi:2-polyprenyl-6-hydroxyphenyl methylase / 3-demethylubiquinone-9 3-methyltransferase|nr:bifunctional 2-polyprenyl-6-hydroxyphenol methylase/3-demethylubiquinol 3-O-methyltransferase UbiG [Rhodanobacter sp.]OJW34237.1 MAG: bifunctional 3-demethylubiquinol 3-O-methyltransferase/2-polyprenyl-6-hydroxyphenol methylase [Rhodanobacter sp. 67-28]